MKQKTIELALAIQLYALEVSKPVPVNEPEAKPDYEAIAKECVEKAELTAPYLFNELENANG